MDCCTRTIDGQDEGFGAKATCRKGWLTGIFLDERFDAPSIGTATLLMDEELQKQGLRGHFRPCRSHWNLPQKRQRAVHPFDVIVCQTCSVRPETCVLNTLTSIVEASCNAVYSPVGNLPRGHHSAQAGRSIMASFRTRNNLLRLYYWTI